MSRLSACVAPCWRVEQPGMAAARMQQSAEPAPPDRCLCGVKQCLGLLPMLYPECATSEHLADSCAAEYTHTHTHTHTRGSTFVACHPPCQEPAPAPAAASLAARAGAVLEVAVVEACSQVRVRGFVRQDEAWSQSNSSVAISLPSLHDCSGAPFRPSSAATTLPNRCALVLAQPASQ